MRLDRHSLFLAPADRIERMASCAVLTTIFVLALSSITRAQEFLETKVDEFIRSEMQRQKIPGVSLAIVKDGKPVLIKGYGIANLEHNVRVVPETIFQSGSVGKQFTATAIMLLVEDDKVRLDEKISKYLGDVPESWKGITIRQLLTHTSGMTDYPDDFDFRRDYTEEELLEKAKTVPLAFAPGEKWQYSNLGFVTLGIIISKVTGKFYGDFLHERIFKPLGMSTARIISEADIVPNRAAGYRLVKGEVKNQNWVAPSMNTTADGPLYLSALDMIKWDDGLRSGKILKKGSLDAMWTPVTLNSGERHPYGFGWAVRTVNGHRVVEHGGAWQGFKAHIARFLDDGLTVILFANLAQADQQKIVKGVASIVDPDLKSRPISDHLPAFSSRIKDLLSALIEKTVDSSGLSPEERKVLEQTDERFLAFVRTLGHFIAFNLMERSDLSNGVYRRYQIEFPTMTLFLDVTVGKDGKITSFALQPE
jgi:CubicO group peptidase (beta-lactamase class C family)